MMKVERAPSLDETAQDSERIVAPSEQRIRPRNIWGLAEFGVAVEYGQRLLRFPQRFVHHPSMRVAA